jgi:hypothetical protein
VVRWLWAAQWGPVVPSLAAEASAASETLSAREAASSRRAEDLAPRRRAEGLVAAVPARFWIPAGRSQPDFGSQPAASAASETLSAREAASSRRAENLAPRRRAEG